MKYKKYALDLKYILEDELEKSNPPLCLSKGLLLYKRFQIKRNGDRWDVISNSDLIHSFHLKSSAILGADYYDRMLFHRLKELIILDTEYSYSITNMNTYQLQLSKVSERDKKDILYSRIDDARLKTRKLKKELKNIFIARFN